MPASTVLPATAATRTRSGAPRFCVPACTGEPRCLRDRSRFAGEHRFVDAAFGPFGHDTVGSEYFTGAHEHLVARLQFDRLHVLDLVVPHAPRGDGSESGERIGDAAGAMARHHLDVAAEREEEHEHRDGIEIDLAVAGQRVPHARHEGDDDAER